MRIMSSKVVHNIHMFLCLIRYRLPLCRCVRLSQRGFFYMCVVRTRLMVPHEGYSPVFATLGLTFFCCCALPCFFSPSNMESSEIAAAGLEDYDSSDIFASDWFGEASPDNELHTVDKGRWAFLPVMEASATKMSMFFFFFFGSVPGGSLCNDLRPARRIVSPACRFSCAFAHVTERSFVVIRLIVRY